MKVKKASARVTRKFNLGDYNSVEFEAVIWADLDETIQDEQGNIIQPGDDPTTSFISLFNEVKAHVRREATELADAIRATRPLPTGGVAAKALKYLDEFAHPEVSPNLVEAMDNAVQAFHDRFSGSPGYEQMAADFSKQILELITEASEPGVVLPSPKKDTSSDTRIQAGKTRTKKLLEKTQREQGGPLPEGVTLPTEPDSVEQFFLAE